ncbi:S8 family serine peptidase [Bdellovibrio sp. SKB1291214]|uniref:S8 family serine peptidase n=1 Tax=Bdellovibrio sp. SKB1291214 TaxID=1732569 RepID=UPI000B517EE1|nr:S8 family serine peptidase [Bdellovibrio sp. SKB1291214]UYL09914.1 S8 family serine peptidase [Bdellovibrio sp. SKB1291214]
MNTPKLSALFAVLVLSLAATSANASKFLVSFKEQTRAQAFKALIQNSSTGIKLDSDLSEIKVLVIKAESQEQILKYIDAKDLNFIEKQTVFAAPRTQLAVTATSGMPRMTLMSAEVPASPGLKMLKVPEAWATTRGKGARVMVIDTGIDKNHPAFAGRIEQMKNFTEDGDPTDATDKEGHGTHVAGIIAGLASVEAVGVAPEATLLIAKVCGVKGCTNDAVPKALGWAYREKVDVVNMSLGGGGSVPERFMINQLDGIQVPVVAAMGNNGMEATPLPAGYPSVEAVGAVDFDGKRAAFSNWSAALDVMAPGVSIRSSVPMGMGRMSVASFQTEAGTFQSLPSVTFTGVPTASLNQSAVYAEFGTVDDLSKVAVAGKILVVKRGNLPLLDKIKNAATAGAAAIIIANNDSALVSGSLTDEPIKIPVIMVETAAGENLILNLMKSPGMNVRLEVQASDYAEFSGTSMASPYVAGVTALMRATVPGLTAWKLRQIMEGTATPIKTDIPNQTGKGLVNAKAAVDGAYAVRKKYKKIKE